jgi:hypothetical protein
VNEDAVPYATENRSKKAEDNLTEKQLQSIEQAIKEADEGKTMSYEEFKRRMSQWLTN